jgi:prevent-host-death family protein
VTKVGSYELRQHLWDYLLRCRKDPVLITFRNEGAAVLVSLGEWERIQQRLADADRKRYGR